MSEAATLNKQTLLALADRCEREEPSRELDIAIELSVVPGAVHRQWDYWFRIGLGDRVYNAPAYTTSLDAAVGLVPDEAEWWDVYVEKDWGGGPAKGEIGTLANSWIKTLAKTPALALCAASLRAIAARLP